MKLFFFIAVGLEVVFDIFVQKVIPRGSGLADDLHGRHVDQETGRRVILSAMVQDHVNSFRIVPTKLEKKLYFCETIQRQMSDPLFFQLVQIATGARASFDAAPTEAEWDALYKTAGEQSVSGVLFGALDVLPEEQMPSRDRDSSLPC